MANPKPQMLVFCYHKCGTVLFENVVRRVAERFGLTMQLHYGLVTEISPTVDIVILAHSLLGFELGRALHRWRPHRARST